MEKLLAGTIATIQKNTFQHSIFSVSRGVEILFVHVLATIVVIISDLSLVIILTIGLLIIDFKTTSALVIVFGLIGLTLFKYLSTKSRSQGILVSQMSIQSDEKIYELLQLYREMKVSRRQYHYLSELNKIRSLIAKIGSDLNFLPYVVKYAIELGFLLAVIVVGMVNFFFGNLSDAIQNASMLIVAGSRLAPSLIRLQQGMVSVSVGLGQTKSTLEYFKELRSNYDIPNRVAEPTNTHIGFSPKISIENVSFIYPNSLAPAIENFNLEIDAGTFVAIVGPSGSGKSTLVDLILGVSEPTFGEVKVSGLAPTHCVARWPGAISYVPQEVSIVNGSVWENVTLGMTPTAAAEDLVKEVLCMAQLEEYSTDRELHSIKNASEFKSKISGGQRQRLGISRALFTKPLLLVLDESTSSLDAITENEISKAINSIRDNKTIIVIAHRLSTVMAADRVVYISAGKIISMGTFDQVRAAVPEFDAQASLMGIPRKPL
jgi:ABC-type multidrug transport system fused ATPase/permease subunit